MERDAILVIKEAEKARKEEYRAAAQRKKQQKDAKQKQIAHDRTRKAKAVALEKAREKSSKEVAGALARTAAEAEDDVFGSCQKRYRMGRVVRRLPLRSFRVAADIVVALFEEVTASPHYHNFCPDLTAFI